MSIVTKQNRGNRTNPDYYIGLDIGTNSVGWAVTDKEYNLLQAGKNGKEMWGVRLFDEAQPAESRRIKRQARRRRRRERVRLNLLKELFRSSIETIDPNFFIRLDNSSLYVAKDENGARTLGSRIAFSKERNIELFGKNKRLHIFEGEKITDNEFYEAFPTVYHLRSALIKGERVQYVDKKDKTIKVIEVEQLYDPRLVYIALYGLLKHRGHFLFGNIDLDKYLSGVELEENIKKIIEVLGLEAIKPIDYAKVKDIYKNKYKIIEELQNDDGIKEEREYTLKLKSEKSKELEKIIAVTNCSDSTCKYDETKKFFNNLLKLSLGMNFTLKRKDDDSIGANFNEDIKLNFSDSEKIEENILKVKEAYEPFGVALEYAYNIYLWALLVDILKEERFLSNAKIKSYEQHTKDLKWLKDTVRYLLKDEDETSSKEKFLSIFGKDTSNFTYEVYIHHGKKPEDKTPLQCFINHINKVLSSEGNNKPFDKYLSDVIDGKIVRGDEYVTDDVKDIRRRLDDGTFLPLQRRGEDVALPNVVIKNEYNTILDKAMFYLNWLKEDDKSKFNSDGSNLLPIDKMKSLIDFKIPYYVGPLAYKDDIKDENDLNKWVVRNEGYENKQILPWEFDKAINKGETRKRFIERMISRCSFIPTCNVLPKNSLLYQKYLVLSELNNLRLRLMEKKLIITKKSL